MSRARGASQWRGLGALCLALLGFAGCGGSNEEGSSPGVRLLLRMTPVEARPSQQVASGIFDALPRQIQPGDISFVTQIRITVTGPGIPGAVEDMLVVTAEQQNRFEARFRKTVPAGNARRIRVAAFNMGEIVIFRGERIVDLGSQADGCGALDSPDADSMCQVEIELERLAVWGNFRWGDPARWTSGNP